MRRIARFLAWTALATIILPLVECSELGAQAFPVMLVDTSISNRLAIEWQPSNQYQHERGYCVRYMEELRPSVEGPLIVYTLTAISRAFEEGASTTGIYRMICPQAPHWVFLHTHPPTSCDDDQCTLGGAWSSQCFASPTDMRTLNTSDKPFELIQCAATAIVPVWRTAPYPHSSPPPESHR